MLFDFDFDTEDDRLEIAGLSVEAAFSIAFVDVRLLFDLRLDCFRIPTAEEDDSFTSSFSLFEAAAATMLYDFDAL